MKRSMKCCGDTGVKQLSGSVAVQGWPESCGRSGSLPYGVCFWRECSSEVASCLFKRAPDPTTKVRGQQAMRITKMKAATWLLGGDFPKEFLLQWMGRRAALS